MFIVKLFFCWFQSALPVWINPRKNRPESDLSGPVSGMTGKKAVKDPLKTPLKCDSCPCLGLAYAMALLFTLNREKRLIFGLPCLSENCSRFAQDHQDLRISDRMSDRISSLWNIKSSISQYLINGRPGRLPSGSKKAEAGVWSRRGAEPCTPHNTRSAPVPGAPDQAGDYPGLFAS